MSTFVLVDGYAMMFRSFYAVRFAPQYQGRNINAVYGCATTLMQAIDHFSPEKLVVAFDAPTKTFRHEADPNYKAQREAAPDEFVSQIELVQELIDTFNIPRLIRPGFEADDIIGTLAKQAEQADWKTFIMSGDLDFLQLVSPNITLSRFNGKDPDLYDEARTIEKLGIPPDSVIDYKALCGDSSDNYKGLPGLGPKGAVKLLKQYGSLAGIYQHLPELPATQQAKFTQHRDDVYHCQHLATIETKVPLEANFTDLPAYQLPTHEVQAFFNRVGFPSLVNRVQNLGSKTEEKNNIDLNNSSKKEDKNEQLSIF